MAPIGSESWTSCRSKLRNSKNTGGRLTNASTSWNELQAERETAYRHLRVEGSVALADLFQRVEAGTPPRSQLRSSAATALVEEVSATLARAQDETELQRLAGDLSKSKRGVPTYQARVAAGEAFAPLADLGLLEWVQPAGRGWNLRLQNGESSRLLFEGVRKELNWVLFVLGKTGDGNTLSCVQLFPDRGPATRRHEKGRKGGGKNKGAKGGKGKGKADNGGGRGGGGGGDQSSAAAPNVVVHPETLNSEGATSGANFFF
ncbi:unnamed protein product [Symbiodinium sp. CCMP2592]|nr:unnamed protein product [Symbiodinium sp. CCMP2592]